jgi:hypothetical protein
MKKIISAISLLCLVFACTQENKVNSDNNAINTKDYTSYGEEFLADEILPIAEFNKAVNNGEFEHVTLKTTINETCKAMGCWMKVDIGNGKEMMVRFKDHEFFIPKDSDGKETVFHGEAYMDTLDVETLKHYAEDAGKPQVEIDAITEPQYELVFEASGVLVKNNK